MASIIDRINRGWNAFMGRDAPVTVNYGTSYSYNPYRYRLTFGNERSIVNAIYNRIAIDVAAVKIEHARLDKNGRYIESMNSKLNKCLNLSANKDQTGRAFIQDCVMSLLDEGTIAICPIDTTINPNNDDVFDIESLRCGKITDWYPDHVRVDCYNDKTGQHERRIWSKRAVAIIENPLYAVMNEPNSTLRRLIRKLNILDVIDEQSGSGKLDLIVQFPGTIRSPAMKARAEQRRADIEQQLNNSKYGIAYADGSEKIVQLNRPIENNLMKTIEYLTNTLYGQLGITEAVLNGTANEQEMLNYYNRTIEPILSAICDEMKRKFLSVTALSQHKSIIFIKDPFKLVPVANIADIADKFTTAEILSPNDVRAIIGYKPVDDPRGDELRNRHLNESPSDMATEPVYPEEEYPEEYEEVEDTAPPDNSADGIKQYVLELVDRLSKM